MQVVGSFGSNPDVLPAVPTMGVAVAAAAVVWLSVALFALGAAVAPSDGRTLTNPGQGKPRERQQNPECGERVKLAWRLQGPANVPWRPRTAISPLCLAPAFGGLGPGLDRQLQWSALPSPQWLPGEIERDSAPATMVLT